MSKVGIAITRDDLTATLFISTTTRISYYINYNDSKCFLYLIQLQYGES